MSEFMSNDKLRNSPELAYDALTLTGESVTQVAPTALELQSGLEDAVRIESVLRLQSLAMGSLRHAARTRIRGDQYSRRHGFAILAASHESDEVYDGATEEYLSYRVAKNDYTNWSMRVRFRRNERVVERRNSSAIDDYYFSWTRQQVVMAANVSSHEVSTDTYTSCDTFSSIRSLSDDEVYELGDRMYRHVERSGAWPEGSFLKTACRENGR